MAGRRRYKSAYRMTSRRKAALRKAQLVSARKRKGRGLKKAGVTVGILATGVGIGVLGTKFGPNAANMAKDLKNRGFRFNNPANAAAMTPAGLEANIIENAVSPAAVARQAPPVNPPNMNNSTTPRPSTRRGMGGAVPASRSPRSTVQVPSAGAVVDPYGVEQLERAADPNTRTIHPMVQKYGRERIVEGLRKIGTSPENATWREIKILSDAWVAKLRENGEKISAVEGKNIYTSILDIMGVDPKWLAEKKAKEGK